MTDIPLPAPGDNDWEDWGDEQETLSDLVRTASVSAVPDTLVKRTSTGWIEAIGVGALQQTDPGWGADAVSTKGYTDSDYAIAVTQSGTSYTLALSDQGKLVETTNGSAVTLTVPPNSSVAFPVGLRVKVRQYGAGQITVTAGAGVTLRSRGTRLKSAGQYAEFTITKRATDEWVVSGDVAV